MPNLNPPPHLPSWVDLEWFFHGGRDVRFDEFVNLSELRQAELVVWLSPLIDGGRKRARKPDDGRRFQKVLGCVIANAIVAMDHGSGTRVHLSRNENEYAGTTPYKPAWLFSTQLLRTIDNLAGAGLLRADTAPRGPKNLKLGRSTFRTVQSLRDGLEERGITRADVVRDAASAPVILLRDALGRNLRYAPAERAGEIDRLRAYNVFLEQQRLEFRPPPEVTVDVAPNLGSRTLRRIYNGAFDRGGRFYGGWWQAIPGELRQFIRINDEPTVELDYASFLPRALYHEAGVDYRHDPYAAPELMEAFDAADVTWEEGRTIVKKLFFLMLNAKGRRGLHATEDAKRLPSTITAREAFDAIQKHNDQINDRFFTGYSMSLMKRESDLCADILSEGLDADVPILPIHDSFVVSVANEAWLKDRMISLYEGVFGYKPIVV